MKATVKVLGLVLGVMLVCTIAAQASVLGPFYFVADVFPADVDEVFIDIDEENGVILLYGREVASGILVYIGGYDISGRLLLAYDNAGSRDMAIYDLITGAFELWRTDGSQLIPLAVGTWVVSTDNPIDGGDGNGDDGNGDDGNGDDGNGDDGGDDGSGDDGNGDDGSDDDNGDGGSGGGSIDDLKPTE